MASVSINKGRVMSNLVFNTSTIEVGHSFGAEHDPRRGGECSPSTNKVLVQYFLADFVQFISRIFCFT